MKTIKTEDFVFNNKTYTIKAWQNLEDFFVVQAFQEEVPVSYQLVLGKIQADDMRIYYSANPVGMMMKHVRRFVEEFESLMLETNKLRNRVPAMA